jgi:hypothetical protein
MALPAGQPRKEPEAAAAAACYESEATAHVYPLYYYRCLKR